MLPGAYLVSSIGTGTYTDDQRIYWPRVVMCVPRAVGATEYVGHLRLEGARYEEEVKLGTGKLHTSRGTRYRFQVADEVPEHATQIKRAQ